MAAGLGCGWRSGQNENSENYLWYGCCIAMEFHLQHGLRINTEPEYKSLYQWVINEVDGKGKLIGHDLIPWPWTLMFTAMSISVHDGFENREDFHEQRHEVESRRVIKAKLYPGREDSEQQTTFSMFGTSRRIEDFQLEIHPAEKSKRDQSCQAWGCVSYTAEIDFRNETIDDCVVFYLFVSDEIFSQYANQIVSGFVDSITFSVGSVDGFYSEWSPSISTRLVKVLTAAAEHEVAGSTKGHLDKFAFLTWSRTR
jgi:hypothetical protein